MQRIEVLQPNSTLQPTSDGLQAKLRSTPRPLKQTTSNNCLCVILILLGFTSVPEPLPASELGATVTGLFDASSATLVSSSAFLQEGLSLAAQLEAALNNKLAACRACLKRAQCLYMFLPCSSP